MIKEKIQMDAGQQILYGAIIIGAVIAVSVFVKFTTWKSPPIQWTSQYIKPWS